MDLLVKCEKCGFYKKKNDRILCVGGKIITFHFDATKHYEALKQHETDPQCYPKAPCNENIYNLCRIK